MIKNNPLHAIGELYAPLSDKCQQELLEQIHLTTVEKGEVIVREGQFANKAYFILQGCARAYYLKDGKDISDWFAFENEFITAIISFFGNEPSPHYIEMLEDTLIMEISRTTIDQLSNKHHDFEHLVRVVVTKTMLRQQERISSTLFHTARERYDHILDTYPGITNRVPLMHIASYLGMTLETLSRIRNTKRRI
ncbi:MAG: Crp/Fnr family transcriptional regulator [Bacteroidota bacterium]